MAQLAKRKWKKAHSVGPQKRVSKEHFAWALNEHLADSSSVLATHSDSELTHISVSEFSELAQLLEKPGTHQSTGACSERTPVCVCLSPMQELWTLTKIPKLFYLPTQAIRKGQANDQLYLLDNVCVEKALWVTWSDSCLGKEKIGHHILERLRVKKTDKSYMFLIKNSSSTMCTTNISRIWAFQAKEIHVTCKHIRNQEPRSPGTDFRKTDLKTATQSNKLTKCLINSNWHSICVFVLKWRKYMGKEMWGTEKMGKVMWKGMTTSPGRYSL